MWRERQREMYKNRLRVKVPRATEVALGEKEGSQKASFLRGSEERHTRQVHKVGKQPV